MRASLPKAEYGTSCPICCGSSGYSYAPFGWTPCGTPPPSQIPEMSRLGAGPDFTFSQYESGGDGVFHFSVFHLSLSAFASLAAPPTGRLGAAVCAREMHWHINPVITKLVKIAKRFSILEDLARRVGLRVYRDPSEFESAVGFGAALGGATSFKVEGKCASSSTAPSGVRIRRIRPTRTPFFGGITSTTMASPTLSEVLCQLASEADGGLPSKTQCCRSPLSSVTSSFIKLCGLAKTHAVTVPFMVTVFS